MSKKIKKPGSLFMFFLLLIIVVFIWFMVICQDFYDYEMDAIEGAAAVVPLDKAGQLVRATPTKTNYDTELKYRTFFVTAPGATKVELLADFNRWGKDPIELKPYRKGYFETSIALMTGEYHYVFSIDGEDKLDPTNLDRKVINGREVCVKTVR